jgi:hypothetical protein
LEHLSKRLDRSSKGALLQIRVARAWEEVAGPRVYAHTTNAHLRAGELVVAVDSPVWATELSALAGPYMEAMNTTLGKDSVRSVRFTVSSRVERERARESAEKATRALYEPDEPDPVPLTETERAQVEASASVVQDEELRKAVIRATVAMMEWRKGERAAKSRERPREGL